MRTYNRIGNRVRCDSELCSCDCVRMCVYVYTRAAVFYNRFYVHLIARKEEVIIFYFQCHTKRDRREDSQACHGKSLRIFIHRVIIIIIMKIIIIL